MATRSTQTVKSKTKAKTLRTSVSFPRDLYDTLERIAQEKKVSLAWIVRDAAEKYVMDQWPLFADSESGRSRSA
ncbi:MAG: ribbon-helix-helix protein, CopG family [Acidimicrobiaceae bacterium]|nr:ribbon-helix-helix protein, CopG family [Acidimicrobiaceae bacterium]